MKLSKAARYNCIGLFIYNYSFGMQRKCILYYRVEVGFTGDKEYYYYIFRCKTTTLYSIIK